MTTGRMVFARPGGSPGGPGAHLPDRYRVGLRGALILANHPTRRSPPCSSITSAAAACAPSVAPLFDGFSKGATACLVCHCLLIETAREGLVLVDTGFGRRDLSRSASSISPFFRTLNNIRFDERLSALTQIEQLGYRAEDVRHIVLTHLDFDHAGGLGDFPDATVHLLAEEKAHAEAPGGGFINRRRYIDRHWQGVRHWQPYAAQGESWKGFAAVKALIGCEAEDIYLVRCAIRWATPGSRSPSPVAGCCTPVTPISTVARSVTRSAIAPRAALLPVDDGGGRPGARRQPAAPAPGGADTARPAHLLQP